MDSEEKEAEKGIMAKLKWLFLAHQTDLKHFHLFHWLAKSVNHQGDNNNDQVKNLTQGARTVWLQFDLVCGELPTCKEEHHIYFALKTIQ